MSTPRSCLECRRRKIRCDRNQPCAYCVRTGIQCEYPTVEGPSNQRLLRPATTPASFLDEPSRLQNLEEHVQQLETRLSNLEGRSQTAISTLQSSSYVPSERSLPPAVTAVQNPEASTGFALRLSPTSGVDLPNWSRDHARHLWQTYLADIDPCLKIVDHQDVEDSLLSYPDISSQRMALIYAIGFATTACKHPNSIEQYQYHAKALESALQRADLFVQPSIPTLQALAIYLICGRLNMDQEYLCTMLLLLVRLASKLRLNQEPAELGFAPIECEHRRRLWWYIVTLDVRTAEACGSEPLILARRNEPKIPSMLRDAALRAGQIFPPTDQHLPCTFYAIMGFEMAQAARQVLFSHHTGEEQTEILEKEKKILLSDRLHQTLFNKYVKHCNCTDSPLCHLTIQWCFIYWARLKLLVLHSNKIFLRQIADSSESDPNGDLLACVSILERIQRLRADNEYLRWAWLWQNCVEWDASAVALCAIATGNCAAESVDRAWVAMDAFFATWTGNFGDPAHRRRWRELVAFRDWVRNTRSDGSSWTLEGT